MLCVSTTASLANIFSTAVFLYIQEKISGQHGLMSHLIIKGHRTFGQQYILATGVCRVRIKIKVNRVRVNVMISWVRVRPWVCHPDVCRPKGLFPKPKGHFGDEPASIM